MTITKTIRKDGLGDYTTIQGFMTYVGGLTQPLTEPVIGEIQDSGSYNENVSISSSIRCTSTNYIKITSTATSVATMPQLFYTSSAILAFFGTADRQGLYVIFDNVRFCYNYVSYPFNYDDTTLVFSRCLFQGVTLANGLGVSKGTMIFDGCVLVNSYVNGEYNKTYYFKFYNCDLLDTRVYQYNQYIVVQNCYVKNTNNEYCFYGVAIRPNFLNSVFDMRNKKALYAIDGGLYYYTLSQVNASKTGGYVTSCVEDDILLNDPDNNDYSIKDNSAYKQYGILGGFIPDYDFLGAGFDRVYPSVGAMQNLSTLTPEMSEVVYPVGKIGNATPYLAWSVGKRVVGNHIGSPVAGTSQFRLAISSYDDYVVLNGGITATDTTITFDGETGTVPSSGVVLIDNELISYSGKTLTQLTGCTRGYANTKAEIHATDVNVYVVPTLKDSWLVGTFYDAGLSWAYSSDYVSGQDPNTSGSWSSMGTGLPGFSGSEVEGTNGVSVSSSNTRYGRVQITGLTEGKRYRAIVFNYNGVEV